MTLSLSVPYEVRRVFKTPCNENVVFGVFDMSLWHFSYDGGHILRNKLSSKLHFLAFQIVMNQEQKKNWNKLVAVR